MNRLFPISLVLALLASLPRPAVAQEDAAATKPPEPLGVLTALEERYQKIAAQLKQPPAKREIKVVASELQKTPLFRADPKLLANKYRATFSLQPAGVDLANKGSLAINYHRLQMDGQTLDKYPEKLAQLLRIGDTPILHARPIYPGTDDAAAEDVSLRFEQLTALCPPEQAPQKRLVEYLTSAESPRDVVQRLVSFAYHPQQGLNALHQQLQYQVFAPTAAEAEERARAIIQLYDGGLWRPMQQFLLEQGQKSLEQARKLDAESSKFTEEIRVLTQKLAKPSEISPDILSQLKAQKVMVAVELAGLSARVKACDAMLTEPRKLEISTLQSISDMKVKAEIERVGIKEKLDQINLFITEGNDREKAQARLLTLESEQGGARSSIHFYGREALRYADLFDLYAPFALVDNQITVGPIEWTQQ